MRLLVPVLMLLALSACGDASIEAAPRKASTAPTLVVPTATESSVVSHGSSGAGEELGPSGYLELRLGMTAGDAEKTGRISLGQSRAGCRGFFLAMYGDGFGLGPHGYFSRAGLAVIHAQGEMRTPQGVGLGTSVNELRDVYPELESEEGMLVAPASRRAQYFFVPDGDQVNYFGLRLNRDSCWKVAFE